LSALCCRKHTQSHKENADDETWPKQSRIGGSASEGANEEEQKNLK
jgi:hypothetical protein